jgi:hypothetical protein
VLNSDSVAAVETYAHDAQPINADDTWKENFVAGELPAGEYRLTMLSNGSIYEQKITIEVGKLTLVQFVVK